MENQTKVGLNRTGMQMSPIAGPDQARFAMSQPANPETGGAEILSAARGAYVQESSRIGSVPMPATGKGLAQTAMGKLKGQNPEVLIDKLGQRLAYERSGVRLYQAMIGKVEAAGHPDQAQLLADLQHICEEELSHFRMLDEAIRSIGGDPTAQTPCADVSAVASMGMIQVITDPRTTVAQSLETMLSVELTDNACWELLIDLTSQAGHDGLVERFRDALENERQHEAMITRWLRDTVLAEAT